MDKHPGGWALRQWYWRVPLPRQWAETSEAFRDRVMAFWIEAAKTDTWTFDELLHLLGDLQDQEADIPAALLSWGAKVATGRECCERRGRKSDPQGDFRSLMAVTFATEVFGWSDRRAYREIAKMPWRRRRPSGEPRPEKMVFRAPKTVESAANRAKGLPK